MYRIGQADKIADRGALDRLLPLLRYVGGDYNDPDTFRALKHALGKARRPAHYLAIPPALFATVIEAAWAVVDPVLRSHRRAQPYKPGSWGPKQADGLIAANGGWHNPTPAKAAT